MATSSSRKPVKATGQMARWGAARKTGGRLLPKVEQFLMTAGRDEDRPTDVIHPSELCKNDFCERAVAMRLLGLPVPLEELPYVRENIFDEGHTIHDKHQRRWWRMGVLWGRWICLYCDHRWLDQSPSECLQCGAGAECLKYGEVPLSSERHRIAGHSDGEIRDEDGNALTEIKSMSKGSLRMEAPQLLSSHTHKVRDYKEREYTMYDHDAMWRELRQPLGNASRQGQLYLALRTFATERLGWPPVDGIDFIYENKHTQAVKEFWVAPDLDLQEELLDRALDVVWAVERGQPPRCPKGRNGCAHCAPYEKEWARAGQQAQGQREGRVEPDRRARHPARGGAVPRAAEEAPRRTPRAAQRPHRARGRGSHGEAHHAHPVGRLLDGAARAGHR